MTRDQTTPQKSIAEIFVDQAKDLPTAPPIVFKLMTLLKKESQHNDEIVDIIRYDEHLTAKLLKLCNSAFFKGSTPVSSVDQVVLRLGYSNILSIAVSLRMGDVVARTKRATYINPYDLWRHSITSAIAAKHLVALSHLSIEPDTGFTAGLLHDIGKVVINVSELEEIGRVSEHAKSYSIPTDQAERDILGTDHAEIGGLLMKKWKLPDEIVDGVRYHHNPQEGTTPVASLCHLASLCANASSGFIQADLIPELVKTGALEASHLSTDNLTNTLAKIKEESAKIETFMMVA